jgi:hypothetical protein
MQNRTILFACIIYNIYGWHIWIMVIVLVRAP